MNRKLKFLNSFKKCDEDGFCFEYVEEDVVDKSWLTIFHMKFKDIIAYLIYDRKWIWLEWLISSLAHTEMELKLVFDKELKEEIEQSDYTAIPKQSLYCQSGPDFCPFGVFTSSIAKFFYGSQCDGYCYYLSKGDFSFNRPTDLLWDGCKECGIGVEDLNVDFDEGDPYNMSEEDMWREYEKTSS